MREFVIDAMSDEDWDDVRAIYREGIATGGATFEEDPPTWEEWNGTHLQSCRLVARRGARVVAWAALSPISTRECYRGVAEATLYVATDHRGAGVGSALGEALIEASEAEGIWTLQAMVFPENEASLALLEGRVPSGRRAETHRKTPGALARRGAAGKAQRGRG